MLHITKLLRPLVRYWQSRALEYLDDGLCAVSGRQVAEAASTLVHSTLDEAGFVTHPDKSVWQLVDAKRGWGLRLT